jgi:ABC-2 type transport system ATP-binding protein
VDFEIGRGESFGLLGPNGAGKTTTINLMVGLLKPDAGSVRVDGCGDPRLPAIRRSIGIAPQSLSLYDDLSARENLVFFGRLYGFEGALLRQRVDWSLEFACLADRQRDRVKTFSGGMKRRLNLACALVHDPRVLLLDEPTVGVDPQSRNHIFDSIEQLQRDGRTIIYTTHYMEEAQRLCDRVAIMDHGRVLDLDTVDNLIDRHGGRAVIKARLQHPPAPSTNLPGDRNGLDWRYEAERPLEEISRLAGQGVMFASLEVTRPDLETVFLTLTGRSLRD